MNGEILSSILHVILNTIIIVSVTTVTGLNFITIYDINLAKVAYKKIISNKCFMVFYSENEDPVLKLEYSDFQIKANIKSMSIYYNNKLICNQHGRYFLIFFQIYYSYKFKKIFKKIIEAHLEDCRDPSIGNNTPFYHITKSKHIITTWVPKNTFISDEFNRFKFLK